VNHSIARKMSAVASGAAVAALLLSATVADARDTLFFGKQKHSKPSAQLGAARTNKKTNFFNKSDVEGCEHVFLSAMIAMTQYAQRVGGNAVVNIRSNYKSNEFSSETEYECGAGNVTGGVAFVGDVVKLP
jgi:hypothetical protein